MVETGVPVLALNACQSAYAEPPEAPEQTDVSDEHQRVRAFGSLAQTVMDTGVSGVVAMRYSVYVVTAAKFVAELYRALASGQTLGAAVTLGRKALADDPLRTLAYDPIPLQDWQVPVVYEAMPLPLFPQRAAPALTITLSQGEAAPPAMASRLSCLSSPTPASSGATKPCWRSTGRLTSTPSSCCTRWRAAARPPPPPSSPAGMC